MIEIKDLHKSFGNLEVLKGITETIKDGEVVSIIGPSGSGKSTFLRCINLLEEPTSGHIIIDGTEITDPKTDINKVRENLGMVFQRFNLFPHKTVLENITLAPINVKGIAQADAEKTARELLQRVGLLDKADSFNAAGGPLFTDVTSAMYGRAEGIKVINYIYGLGGRDVKTNDIEKVYADLAEIVKSGKVESVYNYLGVRE